MSKTDQTAGALPVLRADGPLLVFGGPYSNLEATEALLDEAARRGIPPARMLCTGDVVAYCADAVAVTELMMRSGIAVVMGNCEENLGTDAEDCGCGFAEGTACDLLSRAWYAHATRSLGPGQRAWMRALPRRIDVAIAELRLAAIHGGAAGGPGAINRFLFASAPEDALAAELAATGADGVVAGHCGIPFTRVLARGVWHNAGAIGMPANDGTARVWCSLITPVDERRLRIEHVALGYDHARAAARMRAAGLPEGYAAALASGLWPSCEVLPPDEMARRGLPLDPPAVTWTATRAAAGSSGAG